MTDDELRQLDLLFDNKLSPIRETLNGVHKEIQGVNQRLDTVAGHLVEADEKLGAVDARLTSIEQTQNQDSEQLDRIERKLVKQDDRLEVLEAKTGDLPTPPKVAA